MFLFAGLGNPGPKYELNRHNVGFLVIDELCRRKGVDSLKERHNGLTAKVSFAGESVILVKPQTFMNLSGKSVAAVASFHKIEPSRIVVIHDELDLPYGTVRLKVGGGLAGHNGLRSIAERCGKDFCRLRIGIDRPAKMPVEKYVLSDLNKEQLEAWPSIEATAISCLEMHVKEGPQVAMNRFNR